MLLNATNEKYSFVLTEAGCDPNVECTAWIRQHYIFLLDKLDSMFSGLINHLYQYDVFDQAECDDVRTERTPAKQNERLLSILGRKSPEKINLFFTALEMTDQSHIRKEVVEQHVGTVQYTSFHLLRNKLYFFTSTAMFATPSLPSCKFDMTTPSGWFDLDEIW